MPIVKNRSWLFISILAVIVAILWAGVTAYSNIRKSTISDDVKTLMTPLPTDVDRSLFNKLEQRSR